MAVMVPRSRSSGLVMANGSPELVKRAVFAGPVRYSSRLFCAMAFSCIHNLSCSLRNSRARTCDCCDLLHQDNLVEDFTCISINHHIYTCVKHYVGGEEGVMF